MKVLLDLLHECLPTSKLCLLCVVGREICSFVWTTIMTVARKIFCIPRPRPGCSSYRPAAFTSVLGCCLTWQLKKSTPENEAQREADVKFVQVQLQIWKNVKQAAVDLCGEAVFWLDSRSVLEQLTRPSRETWPFSVQCTKKRMIATGLTGKAVVISWTIRVHFVNFNFLSFPECYLLANASSSIVDDVQLEAPIEVVTVHICSQKFHALNQMTQQTFWQIFNLIWGLFWRWISDQELWCTLGAIRAHLRKSCRWYLMDIKYFLPSAPTMGLLEMCNSISD